MIRVKRVMVAIVVGLVALFGFTTLGNQGWHHYQIWANHGDWCVRFHPDGSKEFLYGAKACAPKENPTALRSG